MRRPHVLSWSIITLLLAGCGFITPSGSTQSSQLDTASTQVTLVDIDLSDPDIVARLGSPPLEDPAWKRNVGGWTLLGAEGSADPGELELIEAAIEEVPDALAELAEPRHLIRIASVQDAEAIGKAVAFTQGPDVYLVDRTFSPNGESTTRLELARALLHELAHVAQYRTLGDGYVTAALQGRIDQVDPATGSTLVRSFAASVGWIDQDDDPLDAAWLLPSSIEAATDYGRTGPGEDMAEAVSLVLMGRADWIPGPHARWVEQWLGVTTTSLAQGKPWAPAGSREVLTQEPLYDEAAVAEAGFRFDHHEPLYFSLPAGVAPHESLVGEIQVELINRRLSGALTRIDDPRLPRYTGLFTRPDGVAMWVELWDFRDATGFQPADPILTYVVMW